jgi:spore germination protein KC
MIKKAASLILSLSLLLSLTGCWSYHGLNEITIVAGVGIDIDPVSKEYLVTCEVIDLASTGEKGGAKAKAVESKGKTIFDAVRNAKKRLINKLYWGNAQVLIIGNELAKQGGLSTAIDWFVSDAECRETIGVIVSQEKTARELLELYGLDNSVIAFEINNIIDEDQTTTGSIENVPLYHVFNELRSPGISVAIPAFRSVINDGEAVVEANGEAIFKDEEMIGYLTPDESKNYLFAVNSIEGGILTFSSSDQDRQDVSLEIAKNSTKTSYSYTGGKIKVTLQTNTDVYLDEIKSGTDMLDEGVITQLETKAQTMLEHNIAGVVQKMQKEYDSDVFGFGNMIYKKDPKLWEQLSPKWDELFQSIQVEVNSKVNILNTSYLKQN